MIEDMSLTRNKHFEATLQVYNPWPFVTFLKVPKTEPPVSQRASSLRTPTLPFQRVLLNTAFSLLTSPHRISARPAVSLLLRCCFVLFPSLRSASALLPEALRVHFA